LAAAAAAAVDLDGVFFARGAFSAFTVTVALATASSALSDLLILAGGGFPSLGEAAPSIDVDIAAAAAFRFAGA
jgi:hypothetical protein